MYILTKLIRYRDIPWHSAKLRGLPLQYYLICKKNILRLKRSFEKIIIKKYKTLTLSGVNNYVSVILNSSRNFQNVLHKKTIKTTLQLFSHQVLKVKFI